MGSSKEGTRFRVAGDLRKKKKKKNKKSRRLNKVQQVDYERSLCYFSGSRFRRKLQIGRLLILDIANAGDLVVQLFTRPPQSAWFTFSVSISQRAPRACHPTLDMNFFSGNRLIKVTCLVHGPRTPFETEVNNERLGHRSGAAGYLLHSSAPIPEFLRTLTAGHSGSVRFIPCCSCLSTNRAPPGFPDKYGPLIYSSFPTWARQPSTCPRYYSLVVTWSDCPSVTGDYGYRINREMRVEQ